MAPKTRILSIDGGGIRGIIPATILSYIESYTGRSIRQLFDIIGGTSTGGILACGLTVPDPLDKRKNKFDAKTLLGLYMSRGADIFQKRFGAGMTVGLLGEQFKHEGLEKVLAEYFGHARLSETLIPILVTAYDIEKRSPFYFTSRLAQDDPLHEDFLLSDVCRSTSAAPTYFEPHLVTNAAGQKFALVDGGVCANNPSLLAYAESAELERRKRRVAQQTSEATLASRGVGARVSKEYNPQMAPNVVLLSLGTGNGLKPYPYKDACGWGAVKWVQPILDILMQGSAESIHNMCQYALPDSPFGKHYYRINPQIDIKYSDMSDVSRRNISGLADIAQKLVEQHRSDIESLCDVLMRLS